MNDAAASLIDELIAVYAHHVRSRVPEGMDGLEAAIVEGAAWLSDALEAELGRPFVEQRRGPLEIFQEAMKFPTAALKNAGLPPPRRDPVVESALPGDRYDLAPASTRDLGENVWSAHLRWGAGKAAALSGGRGG